MFASWLGFEVRVAVRFLREGRLQTLLIMVGVAAGVAVIAYISALVTGLQANTFNKTLGGQAHVSIRSPDDVVLPARAPEEGVTALTDTQPRAQRLRSVANWQALLPLLQAMPAVAAVSPMVSGSALAVRAQASQAIAVLGVVLEPYDQVVRLRDKVIDGTARLAPGDAVIGSELAADLGLRVGDRFSIRTGEVNETVRVSALVDLGVRDLNRRTVIVPLRLAQSLLALPGGATSLDLALVDVWSAKQFSLTLRTRYPYRVESWQETNAQLVSALNAQSVSTGLIRAIVMVVVVLGIASVLVVSVVQKRKEIGILRAVGATRGQMLRVFLWQGAMVGASGALIGTAMGMGLISIFSRILRTESGKALFTLEFDLRLTGIVFLVATVLGLLAAVLPARNAARLDPAQAIRG